MSDLRRYCATGEYHLENHWAAWMVDVADEKGGELLDSRLTL